MRPSYSFVFSLALVVWCPLMGVKADDWPKWRGPAGTGISAETIAPDGWGDRELKRLWKTNVGIGFSSAVVKDGRLFISGNQSDTDTIYCLDAKTGKTLWKHSYESEVWPYLYEGGTNATATVDGGRVYVLGRHGPLFAFDAETGNQLWAVDLHKDLGLEKPSWGFTSAPLVDGAHLYLNAGTHGLALEAATGEVVWKTGTGDAAYAVPEPFRAEGKDGLIVFGMDSVAAVGKEDGEVWWTYPWKTKFKVNAAQPILSDNQLFLSSAYGFGCALLEIDARGAREVWRNTSMQNHFNSCLLIDGHLYGVDGTDASKATLKCLDWKSGEVRWTEKGFGLGSLIAARDWLIVLGDKGELVFAKASPEAFTPAHRAQVLGGKCWTPPTLANGVVYGRNADGDLVAFAIPE